MEKRQYEKPAMQVYELKQPRLLAGSGMEDYDRENPVNW